MDPAASPLDVAVVGAGVVGLAIARELAERGARVAVFERVGIGAGASGVQPGGVRRQWGTEVACRLASESAAFYADADELLCSRVPLGFRRCGYLFLAHSDDTLRRLEENVRLQNLLDVPSRIVTPAEAAELVPGLVVDDIAGGAWCAEDGYFDRPQSVVEAFAQGLDVRIEDVRSLDDVDAETRVVAAGAATIELVPDLPIRAEDRYLFYSEPVAERLLEPLVVATERRFAAKQLGNGRVLAGDLAGSDLAHVRRMIDELLPILTYVSFPLRVQGEYDVTPDHQPIVAEVDGGVWVAAGFSGHGFMIAPAVARIVADAVLDNRRDALLDVLDARRFAEGRAVPEPQLV
ncbi:MAG: NAD(P)/FAD-dependent oxidoreductase [Gaiellaceae bacterium]